MIEFDYIPREKFMLRKDLMIEDPIPGKTAYVFSGGGMRASFGAGVSEVLEEYDVPAPDLEIAISGNIGNRIYAQGKQVREHARKIWRDSLCNKQFICEQSLNLDHLINIFQDKYPLDTEAVRRAHLFQIPVLDYETGNVEYFTNHDHEEYSPAEFKSWFLNVVRAGMAHPLAYRKHVRINGRRYIDGGFGIGIASAVELAAADGATRILVVDNENPNSTYDWAYAAHAWWTHRPLGKRIASRLWKNEAVIPEDVRVTYIHPLEDLPADLLCDDPEKIEATIEAGRRAILEHKDCTELFRRVA